MSLINAVLQEADKINNEQIRKHRDELFCKVKELTERAQVLSFSLQQNFVETYVTFTCIKSLEQLNYKNRKDNVFTDYTKLQNEIETFRKKSEMQDIDLDTNYEKMCKCINFLEDLCVVVEAKRILEMANHEFGRYNYCDSIIAVKDLKNQFNKLKFSGDNKKALSILSEQAENQLAVYSAHLSIEWENIFGWLEKKSLYNITYSLSAQQSDPKLLQKILKTLYVTERLNAELAEFSHFFMEKILHNVIRHNCDIFTEEHIGDIVFNIKIDLNNANKPNYQTVFNNLTAIFEFLQSTLGSQLDADKKFIEIFAESIKAKFFKKIIDDCIRNNLPSCDSSYQNYKNLVLELDSFNKFLIDLKFVEEDKSPLNEYINDTECVLYNKKCDKLLYDVRSLLSESLSYGTIVVGSSQDPENDSVLDVTDRNINWDLNKPIFLPKCVVSQNVKMIMTMIVDHLEESTKLPERYSSQLVLYIKDIAVLYQSVVPKKFKVNLECCPLDIALFFNNCFYLAHGLLGPPWKSILPQVLADQLTTILLECIQDLRVLALEKISIYLQMQKDSITTSIDNTGDMSWTQETCEKLDIGVNKAIIVMNDLKSSWYNILPTKMYEMSICTLVQVLLQSILQRILSDSQPISEQLVYTLALRIEDTVKDICSLFDEPIEFDKKVNVWTKFTQMPQLLKAQLLEISDLWNKNDLSQSFTCEEVRQVIKMRFPDNKYRLKILKEIQ